MVVLKSTELALKLSDSRVKLGEMAAIAEPTDEQRDALSTHQAAHTKLEGDWRDAVRAEAKELDEKRQGDTEFATLESRALADMDCLRAAAEGRDPTGAYAEYVQERTGGTLRSPGGHVLVPIDLLGHHDEQRAAGTTSVADVAPGPDNYRPILGRVFPMPTASRALGISAQSVPFGSVSTPYVNNGAVIENAPAENTRPAAQKITLTTREELPKQAVSAMSIGGLAIHRMGPQLEAAALNDMQADAADQIETNIVDQLDADIADPSDPGAATTWQEAVSLPGTLVDGIYAAGNSDIAMVMHPELMQYLDSLYQSANNDRSAWTELVSKTRACVVSAKLDDPIETGTEWGWALARRGMVAGSFRFWYWDMGELVRDNVSTGGQTVELTLTITYQMDTETDRRDSFAKVAIARAT